MNKRRKIANIGMLSFEDVQALDNDAYIKVNRSFIYFAIAMYGILKQKEVSDAVLPYITPSEDKNLSEYKRHLNANTPYVAMLSQDAKKVFGCLPKDAFWSTSFRKMPKVTGKTFSKI